MDCRSGPNRSGSSHHGKPVCIRCRVPSIVMRRIDSESEPLGNPTEPRSIDEPDPIRGDARDLVRQFAESARSGQLVVPIKSGTGSGKVVVATPDPTHRIHSFSWWRCPASARSSATTRSVAHAVHDRRSLLAVEGSCEWKQLGGSQRRPRARRLARRGKPLRRGGPIGPGLKTPNSRLHFLSKEADLCRIPVRCVARKVPRC